MAMAVRLTDKQKEAALKYARLEYRKLRAKNPFIDQFFKEMNLKVDLPESYRKLERKYLGLKEKDLFKNPKNRKNK